MINTKRVLSKCLGKNKIDVCEECGERIRRVKGEPETTMCPRCYKHARELHEKINLRK
jgi:hypothetical protein